MASRAPGALAPTTLASGGMPSILAAYFEPTATCTMKLALNSPR